MTREVKIIFGKMMMPATEGNYPAQERAKLRRRADEHNMTAYDFLIWDATQPEPSTTAVNNSVRLDEISARASVSEEIERSSTAEQVNTAWINKLVDEPLMPEFESLDLPGIIYKGQKIKSKEMMRIQRLRRYSSSVYDEEGMKSWNIIHHYFSEFKMKEMIMNRSHA